MTVLLLVFVGVLGLVIGSFLNVVVYRVPAGESVVSPRSRCPRCGTAIAWYDDVPVVSWVLLRGRCRACAEPISARYPLVELATAGLFVLIGWSVGVDQDHPWAVPAYLWLTAVGIALALIDVDVRRLPNALVFPSYVVVGVLLVLASVAEAEPWSIVRAALGGVALFAFYFLLVLVYPRGMGWGDVKLAGLLGMALAWLGWGQLIVGGFLGFLLGGVFGIGLMLFRGAGRKAMIPFGPFMIAGALAAVVWGQAIADWYAGVSGV